MKITGQILRENRERKSISVNEVAIATKINAKTIAAMEAGDTANLPPKTFLRGFVRAYATYLELDVESLLSTFFEEMGSTKPKPPEIISTSPRGNSEEADRAINPKTSPIVTIGAVAGILLLVVLIVFFKNKMESYEKEAVPATPPSGLVSLPAASDSQAATAPFVSGTPDPNASATPSESPSTLTSPGASPAVTATSTPTATPSPTPTPKPSATVSPVVPVPTQSPKPTVTPAASATATPSESPAGSPTANPTPTATPKPSKTNEILIEALNDVTIDAKIDGEKKRFALQADQVHTIRAKKVSLLISDGGVVNITVNGNDRGVPGDLGKPKRIELP